MGFSGEQENAGWTTCCPDLHSKTTVGLHARKRLCYHTWHRHYNWQWRSATTESRLPPEERSLLPRFTKKMDSTNNHSHIACFWIEASLSVCCWTSLDYIPPSPTPNNKRANFRLYPEKVEKCEFYQGKGDRNISGGTKNNIYYISQTIKSEGKTNIFRHSSQKNIYYLSSVLRN